MKCVVCGVDLVEHGELGCIVPMMNDIKTLKKKFDILHKAATKLERAAYHHPYKFIADSSEIKELREALEKLGLDKP